MTEQNVALICIMENGSRRYSTPPVDELKKKGINLDLITMPIDLLTDLAHDMTYQQPGKTTGLESIQFTNCQVYVLETRPDPTHRMLVSNQRPCA